MNDYFDLIESHLLDAVERHANRQATRWWSRLRSRPPRAAPIRPGGSISPQKPTTGNIAAACAAAVAIAIAAIAVVFLGGHRPTSASGGGRTYSARQQLIDNLSVLRRPQTKADRQPNMLGVYSIPHLPPQIRKHFGIPDWPLVRAVSIPALGAKVAIIPVRLAGTGASEGLDIALRSQIAGLGASGPVSVATFLARGISDTDYQGTRAGGTLAVIVVPDGVARVALGPFRPSPGPTPLGATINLNGLKATASVHDNLAALIIGAVQAQARRRRRPHEPPVGAVAGVPATVRMTWLAADGKVIGRPMINLPIWINIKRG